MDAGDGAGAPADPTGYNWMGGDCARSCDNHKGATQTLVKPLQTLKPVCEPDMGSKPPSVVLKSLRGVRHKIQNLSIRLR